MHPNKKFAWIERDEMLAFVQQRGFSLISSFIDGRIYTAHAPVSVLRAPDRVQFHLAAGNRLARHLDGKTVSVVTTAFDGYISPDWYVTENQVPTWNYLAVEMDGPVRTLTREELVAQLDMLSAEHEGQLPGKKPWTRDKMTESSFAAMLNGITGFEAMVAEVRGTAKLSQNKALADFSGAVEALKHHQPGLAQLMEDWRRRG
jgi:transcriptional regulator